MEKKCDEIKRIAIEMLKANLSAKEVARIIGVHTSTIYNWSKEQETKQQILDLKSQLFSSK